jgi:hypothetical protein
VPPGAVGVLGRRRDARRVDVRRQLFDAVDPIRVDSREEAIEKVESGEALGALIVPPTPPRSCATRSA